MSRSSTSFTLVHFFLGFTGNNVMDHPLGAFYVSSKRRRNTNVANRHHNICKQRNWPAKNTSCRTAWLQASIIFGTKPQSIFFCMGLQIPSVSLKDARITNAVSCPGFWSSKCRDGAWSTRFTRCCAIGVHIRDKLFFSGWFLALWNYAQENKLLMDIFVLFLNAGFSPLL